MFPSPILGDNLKLYIFALYQLFGIPYEQSSEENYLLYSSYDRSIELKPFGIESLLGDSVFLCRQALGSRTVLMWLVFGLVFMLMLMLVH